MMKCKECRDYKRCLLEAVIRREIFDPEYEGADCFAPISIADLIRNMTDEEMAKWFDAIVVNCHKDCCEGCPLEAACYGNGTLEFLKQPYKEKEE
jgi:hypothetical protein